MTEVTHVLEVIEIAIGTERATGTVITEETRTTAITARAAVAQEVVAIDAKRGSINMLAV